jgi:hypothetical protein
MLSIPPLPWYSKGTEAHTSEVCRGGGSAVVIMIMVAIYHLRLASHPFQEALSPWVRDAPCPVNLACQPLHSGIIKIQHLWLSSHLHIPLSLGPIPSLPWLYNRTIAMDFSYGISTCPLMTPPRDVSLTPRL